MSPTLTLLMAILAGPDADSPPGNPISEAVRPVTETPFASLREAREAVKRSLRESNRASGRAPVATVPGVVAVHRRLAHSETLSTGERRRLQAQLNVRLSELESALRRREQRATPSSAGGVAANAQELID